MFILVSSIIQNIDNKGAMFKNKPAAQAAGADPS